MKTNVSILCLTVIFCGCAHVVVLNRHEVQDLAEFRAPRKDVFYIGTLDSYHYLSFRDDCYGFIQLRKVGTNDLHLSANFPYEAKQLRQINFFSVLQEPTWNICTNWIDYFEKR